MSKTGIYCEDCDESPCQCGLTLCGSAYSRCILESDE